MRRQAILALIVLYGLWLGLSGHYNPFLLGMGGLAAAGTVLLGIRLGIFGRGQPAYLRPGILAYAPWLVMAIIHANWDVAHRVWRGRSAIAPRLVRVPAQQNDPALVAIYANSITLTPGTVATSTDGWTIVVHALTAESAAEVEGGEMGARVARLGARG